LRTGAACNRLVQARELGLDVVELLQGLAAAGGQAFINSDMLSFMAAVPRWPV
jgi:hypothetical protein